MVDIAADERNEDADDNDGSEEGVDVRTADSFLNSVKHRLEEFQKDVKVKGEVERDLERSRVFFPSWPAHGHSIFIGILV